MSLREQGNAPEYRVETAEGRTVISRLAVARSFLARGVGLLGKSGLPVGSGLCIDPCDAIHTFFMRFPIDVIFIDRDWRVTRVVRNLGPWRMVSGGGRTRSTIEVASGWLSVAGLEPGLQLVRRD
jgi:hypothetical protein